MSLTRRLTLLVSGVTVAPSGIELNAHTHGLPLIVGGVATTPSTLPGNRDGFAVKMRVLFTLN